MTVAWMEGPYPEWLQPIAAGYGGQSIAEDDSSAYDWLQRGASSTQNAQDNNALYSALKEGTTGHGAQKQDIPDYLMEMFKTPMRGATNSNADFFNSMVGRDGSKDRDKGIVNRPHTFGEQPHSMPQSGAGAMLEWINSGDANGFPNQALAYQQFMGGAAGAAIPQPQVERPETQAAQGGAQWSQQWSGGSGPGNTFTAMDNQNHSKEQFGAFESGGGLNANHSVL